MEIFLYICHCLIYFVIQTSLKFNDFLKTKLKNNLLTIEIFIQSTKSSHFSLKEKVGQLIVRARECFDGLSIFLVYGSSFGCVEYQFELSCICRP